MTRWLLLFFVFLLPAQFAWSAAAVYCEHETAPSAFHLGHHAHQHQDAAAGAGDTAVAAQAADDVLPPPHPDCGYCHASVTQLPTGLASLFEAPRRHSFARPPRQHYLSRIEPDIDRPKWTRAS